MFTLQCALGSRLERSNSPRDPSIRIILTLGPKVCEYYLLRVGSHQQLSHLTRDVTQFAAEESSSGDFFRLTRYRVQGLGHWVKMLCADAMEI